MAIGDKKNKRPLSFKEEPVMTPRKKRMTISEAEGGFIVRSDFGMDDEKVAKTLAAVIKMVKAEFGSADASEDEDE